jgi:hypothetical protein
MGELTLLRNQLRSRHSFWSDAPEKLIKGLAFEVKVTVELTKFIATSKGGDESFELWKVKVRDGLVRPVISTDRSVKS